MLDEPLAALDARTRLLVRGELRRHLADFGGAALVVTHDPVDAAVLADRLVVIENGTLVQQGTPIEVARRPRTDYVARLVGLNLLAGEGSERRVRLDTGGSVEVAGPVRGGVYVAFRPSAVSLFTQRPDGTPRNLWLGRITAVEPHGEGVRIEVGEVPARGSSILAEVTPAAVAELGSRRNARSGSRSRRPRSRSIRARATAVPYGEPVSSVAFPTRCWATDRRRGTGGARGPRPAARER